MKRGAPGALDCVIVPSATRRRRREPADYGRWRARVNREGRPMTTKRWGSGLTAGVLVAATSILAQGGAPQAPGPNVPQVARAPRPTPPTREPDAPGF